MCAFFILQGPIIRHLQESETHFLLPMHHRCRLSARSSSPLPSLGSFIITIAVSLLVHRHRCRVSGGFCLLVCAWIVRSCRSSVFSLRGHIYIVRAALSLSYQISIENCSRSKQPFWTSGSACWAKIDSPRLCAAV